MKTLVIAFATLMTGGIAATAHASTIVDQDMRQQIVSYADLDPQNAADAETLLRRIKSAARNVCGVRNSGPLPIDFQARLQGCAKEATARAVAEVVARHDAQVRVATAE